MVERLFAFACLWLVASGAALAAIPSPPGVAASAHILVDFHSGQVLSEHEADARMEPASLVKMMTTYVVLAELAAGHIHLTDKVRISEKAWRKGGSKMFVEVNSEVSLEDLLKGVIIQSGNDASIALAEHVAGSEESFTQLMNNHARRLGLTGTHFTNSTGWPDPDLHTTARDMAHLGAALIRDFPEHYGWHAIKSFVFNGINQQNRNRLLWRDDGVDGIKTGHTEAAGYCLVASAQRESMRLIAVVMGVQSEKVRADETGKLLSFGFRFYETHRIYAAEQPLTSARVWLGAQQEVSLGLLEDLYVTVPRGQYESAAVSLTADPAITAPVERGDPRGFLRVTLGEQTLLERPLLALSPVGEGGIVRKAVDTVLLWFQ